MHTARPVVSRHVILELIGPEGSAPVEAELRYDPIDPYAVSVVFHTADKEVVWVFGRDLLMRGLAQPAGEGDVQLYPSLRQDGHAVVVLELCSPGGQAVMELQTSDLLGFLAHTTREVWPGTEGDLVEVDAAIDEILVRG